MKHCRRLFFHRWSWFFGMTLGNIALLWMACGAPQGPAPCETNDDCPSSERCQQRNCVARTRCTAANAQLVCLPGEACQEGFCIRPKQTNQGECQINEDCTAPNVCESISRRCVRCLRDSDCEFGQRCNAANLCITPAEPTPEPIPETTPEPEGEPGACASNLDCQDKPNQYCDLIEKRCKARTGATCQADKDCPSQQHCVSGVCTLGWRSCAAAPSACQTEFECRNNLCYPKVCQTDQDCEPGRPCNQQFGLCQATDCTTAGCPADYQCNATSKLCEPKPTDCTTTGCPTDQQCNPTTKLCEPKTAGCQNNNDCNAPKGTCHQGQCAACGSDFPCPSGQICESASGLCKTQGACAQDSECTPPAGACNNGVCQSCASNFSCTAPKTCDFPTGRCVGGSCTSNIGCLSSQFCKNGQCAPKECDPATGLSCSAGETCTNFECTGGAPRNCTTNSNCRVNEFCKVGTCAPQECNATLSCPSGQTCQNFQCIVQINRQACTSNANCPSGHTCVDDGSGTYCYQNCAAPDTQSTCSNVEICVRVTSTLTLCLPKGTFTLGQSCRIVENRCDVQHVCLYATSSSTDGTCYRRCNNLGSSAECTTGHTCQELGVNRVCLTPPTQQYLQTCGTMSQRCVSPLICVNTGFSSSCYRPCNSNADCTFPYDVCSNLQNGGKFCYL